MNGRNLLNTVNHTKNGAVQKHGAVFLFPQVLPALFLTNDSYVGGIGRKYNRGVA